MGDSKPESVGIRTIANPFISGGASGMLATGVIQLIEMVKVRIQLGQVSAVQVAKDTLVQEGFGSCYKGLSPGLLRQATYTTARLGSFSGGIPLAYCDAGAALDEGYIPNLRSASENILQHESLKYRTKEYAIELKPLFSAFGLKSLAITSVRSFLLFYLPLLEPRPHAEDDDDDDFLQESPEEKPVDLVVPFKNSIKQIFRETAVVTTRRLLERLVVQNVSQRMAWKLLKDISQSAKRKAARGMPTTLFVYSVSRTTFRGHLLGVAASWVIQIIIETYRCLIRKTGNNDESDADRAEKIRLLGKVYATTIKCGASLVFASIGAGIGALLHPSTGQWIGCALGDFAGPIIAIICFEKLHLEL